MLLILCLVAAAVAVPAPTKTRYDGYEVLAVVPETVLQMKYLISLSDDIELDFWMEGPLNHESHIMVPPSRQAGLRKQLTKRRIAFHVHIQNVQEGIDAEQMELAKNKRVFDYDQYNTFADIQEEISRLAGSCPDGCECDERNIGMSEQGEPLTMLSIMCDADNPSVWIDSTIHAREWLAPATVFRFIRRIWGEEDNLDDDGLREDYNFHFMPVMNPDGYKYTWESTRMWRKNRGQNSGSGCIGTDLNRNYETNWSISGTTTNPCGDTFHGDGPASESETQAVQAEVRRLDGELSAFVSVHTYGNYWLHPWGHAQGGSCVISPDHDDQFEVANAAADAAAGAESDNNNWLRGNSCATIYPASGLTLEYAYMWENGGNSGGTKYTYTPELRGGSFNPPASAIGPSDNEFYAAISAQMRKIEEIEGDMK